MAQRVERWTHDQQVELKFYSGQKLHNNLGQVVHTYVSVTKQYNLVPANGAVMLCGWEGNRRPGGK